MAQYPKILVTAPIPAQAADKLKATFGTQFPQWTQSAVMPRAELMAQAAGVHGIFCLINDRIDAPLLEAAGASLRVVSTMSVGYDHIDVAACRAHGVTVGNTPGVLTETTAELALALMLATARRLPEALAAVQDGSWGPWQPEWLVGLDVSGSTVGIVGMGRIGMAVARLLSGFGCRILYASPRRNPEAEASGAQYATLETLLTESDFVTLHAPLNEQTRHLINRNTLRCMKPDAILINTSRGGLVDQDALHEALQDGTIAAAGLDVTTPEPLPTNHPLLSLPNCVVLPHIGSASRATRRRMALLAVDNLIAGVSGQPLPHPVA